ncbi:hypothetical protein Nepgr_022360 [Nepenthes gracilis]|uniref:DYW domain-containing protein n=1 Tax=Nepenthes gracilis TaxID=150966 RepID=A0AAD3XY02_NEPGR|nr:hypothetical protein Nepgr_022360 [Nepenthes gracilis]
MIREPHSALIILRSLLYSSLIINSSSYIKLGRAFLYNLTSKKCFCSARFPQSHSLILTLDSCPSVSNCLAVHARVIKFCYINDDFIGDRLVSHYVKLDHNEDANKLFDEIPLKDLVSWNSLLSGFSRKGHLGNCLNVFSRLRIEGGVEPNEVTLISIVSACTDKGARDEGKFIHGFAFKTGYLEKTKVVNSLINMYGKFGALDSASELIRTMQVPNLISWNSILSVHAQNGLSNEVMSLFRSMRRDGIGPDQATMVSIFQGCNEMGIAKQVETIHVYTFKCGFAEDIRVMTSLLISYAKSGRLNAGKQVFGEMKARDRVTWTAMLASYAMHGCGNGAIELFESMVKDGVDPDHVTFTHLLNACSHSGLIVAGNKYFKNMYEVYGIEPRLDHYSCMVDLLGRLGLLEDAYGLIKSMPMQPNAGVWGALLGACRIFHNIELGQQVAEQLFALDPTDHRNYVMLSNIYAASGLWRNASKIRSLMKERGLVSIPGCSLIEHENKVYRFVAGDCSHPESDKIYAKLEQLIARILKAGFVRQTQFVLHDVDEYMKEDMINKHSEKLAIAFGLLVSSKGMPITIIKNLRICGDCHSMAKLVSLVENRTIIIRDLKRFHHFADGMCSCGDYW